MEDIEMKKYIRLLFVVIFIFIMSGCGNITDTPSSKVENFMSKYQRLDSEVLLQLDNVVSSNNELTDDQKEDYRGLMERQYQDLSYKIKDEKINGENATVIVEVEVYDYRNSINKSEAYYEQNKKDFQKEDGTLDLKKYWDYKIKEMKIVDDRVKQEITFTFHKDDGKWILEDLSDLDRDKIHGLY